MLTLAISFSKHHFPFLPRPPPPTATIAVAHTGTWTLGHVSRILEKWANLNTIFIKIFIYFYSSHWYHWSIKKWFCLWWFSKTFQCSWWEVLKLTQVLSQRASLHALHAEWESYPKISRGRLGSIVLQLVATIDHMSRLCPGSRLLPRVQAPPRVSPWQ